MKQGRTLQALGKELERQRNARQDFIADTRSIEMESVPGASHLRLEVNGVSQEFGVGESAHQQIAARLGIPYRYYQKMQVEQREAIDKLILRLPLSLPVRSELSHKPTLLEREASSSRRSSILPIIFPSFLRGGIMPNFQR